MSSERHRRRGAAWALVALLPLLAAVAACGRKGEPQPPLRLIPVAAEDLAFFQLGDQITLRLGYPRSTTAGTPLPGLDRLEVWRLTRPLPEPQAEPPVVDRREFDAQAERLVTLEGPELSSAVEGDRIVARLPLEEAAEPVVHVYGVRTVATGGEASAWSNLVRLVPMPAPEAPHDLQVVPRADGVEVGWQSAGENPAEGFHVYRRLAVERSYGDPLRFVGPAQRRMVDDTAVLGERYIYTVTAVASRRPRRESGLAEEREVDYQDRFAPPPPAGLQALPQEGGMRLVWQPSPAADLAGYHVYRQDPRAEPRRLTAAPQAELRFLDEGLVAGLEYRYRVTAVDAAGNEGEAAETLARPR